MARSSGRNSQYEAHEKKEGGTRRGYKLGWETMSSGAKDAITLTGAPGAANEHVEGQSYFWSLSKLSRARLSCFCGLQYFHYGGTSTLCHVLSTHYQFTYVLYFRRWCLGVPNWNCWLLTYTTQNIAY